MMHLINAPVAKEHNIYSTQCRQRMQKRLRELLKTTRITVDIPQTLRQVYSVYVHVYNYVY